MSNSCNHKSSFIYKPPPIAALAVVKNGVISILMFEGISFCFERNSFISLSKLFSPFLVGGYSSV
jgi:hypothetical protein